MKELTQLQWLKHAVTHPFEGFDDMRWKKAGSLKIAFAVVFLLFLALVADGRLYGFQFRSVQEETFSVMPYLMKSAVLFGAWVVGNWSVCTILSGEGTMRNICIFSAYALVPYIGQLFINTALSHILIRDEAVFMSIIEIIGTLWTVLLIFTAVRAAHGYSVLRTVSAILLTLGAALIMLILLILLMSLIQQIYVFISTIITEITYRIRS